MRKIATFFIVALLTTTVVKSQYVNIPDTNFRNFLIQKYPTCFNSAKQMDTTCSANLGASQFDCFGHNITNLDGLQYFGRIEQLDCSNNNLTSLPNLPSSIYYLECGNNPNLSCLPLLHNGMQYIGTSGTNIKCIPNAILPHNNYLTMNPALPFCNSSNNINNCAIYSNPYVYIQDDSLRNYLHNKIPSAMDAYYPWDLDTTSSLVINADSLIKSVYIRKTNNTSQILNYFKNLVYLKCMAEGDTLPLLPNTVKYLDFSMLSTFNYFEKLPDSLRYLKAGQIQLLALPKLPSQLRVLDVSYNLLDTLPTLPPSLKTLDCTNNPNLVNLPTLNNGLENLTCVFNNITSLPPLPNTLKSLDCSNTSISCLPLLPSSLTSLTMFATNVHCSPNHPSGLVVFGAILPICNTTNNPNQCEAYPTVVGKMFYDINSNGVKDANEPYKVFGQVALSSGDYSFTDANGYYAITAPDTGSYTIQFAAPNFYNAVPAISSVSFHRYDSTIFLPDIALQPTAVKDSLQIFATPLYQFARPGFGSPYFVGFANVGTTSLSPNIKLSYDNNNLIYDSCNNALVTNSGTDLNLVNPNMPAGQLGYYVGYFRVKPTANLGDTIKAIASITSPATAAVYDAPYSIVTGSFDPNDKDATPVLTPSEVAAGKKINYTIRFQNTGSDTAFTVVLADTLSNLLQTNSLEIIGSSHPCKVSVKSGVAYFEFKNIKLPYQSQSEIKSHGFVRFTVKPKTTLTVGTSIYNKAYIYFDYNKPIITNTAVTQIKVVVVPVKLTVYSLQLIGDGKQVLNSWQTASEINTSHFNVQRSINNNDFKTIGTIAAKGFGEYSFNDNQLPIPNNQLTIYYRLEIVDKDGSKTYSEVKEIRLTQLTNKLINVYPNPARDVVNIECKEDAKKILIIDCFGKIVYADNTNRKLYIVNLQSFTKGIYIVQVITKNGEVRNEKLIVE